VGLVVDVVVPPKLNPVEGVVVDVVPNRLVEGVVVDVPPKLKPELVLPVPVPPKLNAPEDVGFVVPPMPKLLLVSPVLLPKLRFEPALTVCTSLIANFWSFTSALRSLGGLANGSRLSP